MNTNLRERYNKIAENWNGQAYEGLRRDDLLPQIIEAAQIEQFPKTVKILEAMCGTAQVGIAAKKAAEDSGKKCKLALLDFSEEMLAQANIHARKVCCDACDMPFLSESFDCVFTRFALHDIEREKQILVLHEVKRVLRPKCLYVLVAYCATARTQEAYNTIVNLKDKLAGNKGESDRYFPTREEYAKLLHYAGFNSVETALDFAGTIRYQRTAEMKENGGLWAEFVLNLPEDIKNEIGIKIQFDGTVEYQFPATIFVARK